MKLKTILKKQTTHICLGGPIVRTLAEAVSYDGNIIKADGTLLSNVATIAEMCGASVRNLDGLGRTAKACAVVAEHLEREAAALRLQSCKGDTPVKAGLTEYALWGATTAALWAIQGNDRHIDSDEAGAVFALALICGMTIAVSVDRDDVSTKTIAKAISVAVNEFAHDDGYSRCQPDHISICACGALYDVGIIAGDHCGLTGVADATISKLISSFDAGLTVSQETQDKITAMIQEKHAKAGESAQQAGESAQRTVGADEPVTRTTSEAPDIVAASEPDFFGLRTNDPFADFFKNYSASDDTPPKESAAVAVQPDGVFSDDDKVKSSTKFFARVRSGSRRKTNKSQRSYGLPDNAPESIMTNFDMPLPGDPFTPAPRPQRAFSQPAPVPKKQFSFERIYDQGAEKTQTLFNFERIYDQGAE